MRCGRLGVSRSAPRSSSAVSVSSRIRRSHEAGEPAENPRRRRPRRAGSRARVTHTHHCRTPLLVLPPHKRRRRFGPRRSRAPTPPNCKGEGSIEARNDIRRTRSGPCFTGRSPLPRGATTRAPASSEAPPSWTSRSLGHSQGGLAPHEMQRAGLARRREIVGEPMPAPPSPAHP